MMKMTTLFCWCGQVYTKYMHYFVQPTPAPTSKTPNVRLISTGLAAVFVLLAVAQLYSYEDFPAVIAGFWLPVDESFASVIAALIVTGEVVAVPFLLGMRLSHAMRLVSMFAGWLVIASWLVLSLWVNASDDIVGNAGVLGATIPTVPGWWMVTIFASLGVLMAWASWGMWPLARVKQKRSVESLHH